LTIFLFDSELIQVSMISKQAQCAQYLFLFFIFASCSPAPVDIVSLSNGWSYRRGNETGAAGCLVETGWEDRPERAARMPFHFQKRAVINKEGGSLQFMTVDQIVVLYANGAPLLNAGDPDNADGQLTTGNTLHIVELPTGKTELCFKVYAPGSYSAIVGDILLAREGLLIRRLLAKEGLQIFLAALGLSVGLCLILAFCYSRTEPGYLYFGFYLFFTCAWAMAQSLSKQFLVSNPFFWRAVDLATLFQMPIWMALFYRRIFGPSYFRIFDLYWVFHAFYAIFAYFVILAEWLRPEALFLPFQISAISLILMLVASSVYKSYAGDMEARLLFSGLAILCLAGIHDFMNALGLLAWRAPITAYAILFPLLAGIVILIRRSFSGRADGMPVNDYRPLFIKLQTKFGLTYQEARICCDISAGKDRSAIRRDYNIAETTLKSQLSSIYRKTIERTRAKGERRDKMQRLTIFLRDLDAQ
jgi:hypothetical protein